MFLGYHVTFLKKRCEPQIFNFLCGTQSIFNPT
jgi:hypothetical protein